MHFFLVDYFIPLISFGLFGLVEFTTDLHPYDIVHHDITRHDTLWYENVDNYDFFRLKNLLPLKIYLG